MDYEKIALEELTKLGQVRINPYELNLVGFRNIDDMNTFNDAFVYWYYDEEKKPVFETVNKFTTDPGLDTLRAPVNAKGCAILVCNYFYRNLWKIGFHKGQYRALVQHTNCKVFRDNNRNSVMDLCPKTIDEGHFGINLHRANPAATSVLVNNWSAGCQVFANYLQFDKFMKCVDKANKYGQQFFDYLLLNEKTYMNNVW
jgi:hypothetical protein